MTAVPTSPAPVSALAAMTPMPTTESAAALARRPAWTQSSEPSGRAPEANAVAPNLEAALSTLTPDDDLAQTLGPLLRAVGWDGPPRALAEALPHVTDRLDLTALRDVMASLGYGSMLLHGIRADRVDPRLFPALLVPRRGRARVILGPIRPDGTASPRGRIWVHDPVLGTPTLQPLAEQVGDVCLFRAGDDGPEGLASVESNRSLGHLLERFCGLYAPVVALTFLAYVLAVAPALFVMGVYDRVIPAESLTTLISLLVGVAIAIVGEAILRLLRGRLLGRLRTRFGLLLTGGLFARLLLLPLAPVERMRMGARVQRIRQAGALRDTLAGPAAVTLIELPFAAIFIVVLALIAGSLALVPLAAVPVYALVAFILAAPLRRAAQAAARSAQAKQDFLYEAITHGEHLRLLGATPRWEERFRKLSGDAAFAGYRAQALAAVATALGQAIMAVAGLLTVGLGALAAIAGELSVGALIAVMTLTWRTLMPMQSAFLLLPRLEQARATAGAIAEALEAKGEADPLLPRRGREPVGRGHGSPNVRAGGVRITLQRCTFRYTAELDLALMALNDEIRPGEIVAVTGPNGAGKSTLLRLVLGLYRPQAGSVLVDGIDIRQHDPLQLRQAIGHVPQEVELFHGTLAQNLRLAMPTASVEDIATAIDLAGIGSLLARLPDGLQQFVGDGRSRSLPGSLTAGVALAAAYLRAPRLLLLDEAIDVLDPELTQVLHTRLAELRGHVTVVMVTHRPATMRLADRILVLNAGSIVRNGPPEKLM
ncbi:MAG: ATP-binding cassette domain-containing protein [Geminicoccaceae bacterium]|nr:MAG: ATP-binding cassette domain-containing protein [Geminicoccaceae bacterium]